MSGTPLVLLGLWDKSHGKSGGLLVDLDPVNLHSALARAHDKVRDHGENVDGDEHSHNAAFGFVLANPAARADSERDAGDKK